MSDARPGPLLDATGLSKRYGGRAALVDVGVSVSAGESLALIGPNGSGKTTLLRILAGVTRPDGGAVEGSATRDEVGWAPHDPALYRRLTVRENLRFFAALEGAHDPDQVAAALIERADLARFADQQAGQLSTGTMQRLNLSIALAGEPAVLLLDEPTATLSPDQRHRMWEWLEQLRAETRVAIVFATQDLAEAMRSDGRVIVISSGRVVFDGAARDLGPDLVAAEARFMALTGAAET